MTTAKLFLNGKSQAVRLPKEFRFKDGDKVYIKKRGNATVLLPIDAPWDNLINSLDKFSDDCFDSRNQPGIQTRELF